MNGRYLLDTNIVIALLEGEPTVSERVAGAGEVFLSAVTLGELYYGAAKSTRAEHNLARVDEFATARGVLACDQATAREYGVIKAMLRARGKPLPDNDIWIAALARLHGLTLVTRDAHFREVEALTVEVW